MTQGDYVKISSTTEVDAKLKHLEARIRGWNYQSPLVIKLTPFTDPTSLSQDAMFNIWCREIADQMKVKTPSADAEAWKLWLKHKFLGTYAVKGLSKATPYALIPAMRPADGPPQGDLDAPRARVRRARS